MSNDEVDDDEENEPPLKTQRHRYHSSQRARRQRSATPDHQLDERVHGAFEGSQGSLYERDVAGAQIKISEKPVRSPSSSSCSEAENAPMGHRRSQQRSSGRSAGDSRIRRSRYDRIASELRPESNALLRRPHRSLQLTERSPSRAHGNKTVIKIVGSAKERTPPHLRANPPPVVASVRSAGSRSRHATAEWPRDAAKADIEKSRSLDSDYDCYQCNDFDKSHSFDEDFADSAGCRHLDDSRSYSIDQMHSKGKQKSQSLRVHDSSRAAPRGPNAPVKQRYRIGHERTPKPEPAYRNPARALDQPQYQKALRDHSPSKLHAMHSSFGSNTSSGYEYDDGRAAYSDDYELRDGALNDELIKEAKLVSNFLYGGKAKADTLSNQRRADAKPSRKGAAPAAAAGRYKL